MDRNRHLTNTPTLALFGLRLLHQHCVIFFIISLITIIIIQMIIIMVVAVVVVAVVTTSCSVASILA